MKAKRQVGARDAQGNVRVDVRGLEILKSGVKYYAVDPGLRYHINGNRAGDSGRMPAHNGGKLFPTNHARFGIMSLSECGSSSAR